MRPLVRTLFGTKLNAALTLLMLAAFAWALPPLFRWLLSDAAFMAETIRGGLQGVPRGQADAAAALGLHPAQVQLLIVLPQALRLSIPGIVNIAVDLFKDTPWSPSSACST